MKTLIIICLIVADLTLIAIVVRNIQLHIKSPETEKAGEVFTALLFLIAYVCATVLSFTL